MKYKYPKSWHLGYSEKTSSDDKQHQNDRHFNGKNVVVTIKMDGENTTIYNNTSHARSMDSNIDSEDRRWIESLRISKVENNIPINYRICGENMFWKHTCAYDDLESMFLAFSIWDGDTCLSWDGTKMWCKLLGLSIVPVLYEGIYDKDIILNRFSEYIKNNKDVEGFVVRIEDEFNISDFSNSLSKYVRKSFVIPSQHWRYSKKIPNKLSDDQNPWNII